MAEYRKNRLSINGGQVDQDGYIESYKAISEYDDDLPSKRISKIEEKSLDNTEEIPLQENEVDDIEDFPAKCVIEDCEEVSIELDVPQKQFSGLTKEELLKYADDPFWVRLRWCLFVLFWAMWLAMLGGAIIIISNTSKCYMTPREWYDIGPIITDVTYESFYENLDRLKSSKVQAVVIQVPTYSVLDDAIPKQFEELIQKAKESNIKVIVELSPNSVPSTHKWFKEKDGNYSDYFIWAPGTGNASKLVYPNNWLNSSGRSAWTYNDAHNEFFLQQFGQDKADLDFYNKEVVQNFVEVQQAWMKAGANGVRLTNVRRLLINVNLADVDEKMPKLDGDLPELHALLEKFSQNITKEDEKTVFTVKEENELQELYLKEQKNHNMSYLRPPSSATLHLTENSSYIASVLNAKLVDPWPAIELSYDTDAAQELALFALLLPAGPVLQPEQFFTNDNSTTAEEDIGHLISLRNSLCIRNGSYSIIPVPDVNSTQQLLACFRWLKGHMAYVAIFNPTNTRLTPNLSGEHTVAETLRVHHMSKATKLYTKYTLSYWDKADKFVVPPKSTLVLSYTPKLKK